MKNYINQIQIVTLAGLLSLGIHTYSNIPVVKAANNVAICHRGNAVANPYQRITVDLDAQNGNGDNDHTLHTGPVATSQAYAQTLKDAQQNWGDIIPNLLNWTADGQAMWNNDCNYVIASPSVSPSVSPSIEPSADPSIEPSPSTDPSVEPSPSVSPSVTPTPTPTPTATPNNNTNSSNDSGSSSNSPAPQGQVLGAFASTGVAEDAIMNALGSLGGLMTLAGSVLYGKKRK
jgi:hypothetical protein